MSTNADPRFQRSREAILAAARVLLLEHGPSAVTHQRIAEHAQIGRATVYRHWPHPHQLLGAAMATVPLPFFAKPVSPYRQWLLKEMTSLAREFELPDVRAVATTLANAAIWDTAINEQRRNYAQTLAARLSRGLQDAQRHGEFTPAVSVENAAALLLGPLLYRTTIEQVSINTTLIESSINTIGTWNMSPLRST